MEIHLLILIHFLLLFFKLLRGFGSWVYGYRFSNLKNLIKLSNAHNLSLKL